MVVLLVLFTFAFFVTLELIRERREARTALQGDPIHAAARTSHPAWVAGFRLPEALRYYPGHTWLQMVEPDVAYVGADDFARRLIGKPTRTHLPAVGTFLHRGEPSVEVEHGRLHAELLSPTDGEVIAVNPRLQKDPGLLHRDPYGLGWLYKVRSRNLARDAGSLLDGSLARKWMEDTWERFQHQLMLASGSVIQDGGAPLEDLAETLDPELWNGLTHRFLALNQDRS